MSHLNQKAVLGHLRTAIETALKPVGEKYRTTFSLGKMSYLRDGSSCKVPLEIIANSADGQPVDRAKQNFELFAESFGLAKGDFGRTFISRGTVYEIVALKEASFKYPIIGRNANGTRYKFAVVEVKLGMIPEPDKEKV